MKKLTFWVCNLILGLSVPSPALADLVSAGSNFSCAIKHGRVKCWGFNFDGGLGILPLRDPTTGAAIRRNYALSIGGINEAGSVSVGRHHACALVAGGQVFCWGGNYSKQLGAGSEEFSAVPVLVDRLPENVSQISAGTNHTCALVETGSVYCWGSNVTGQLGNRTSTGFTSVPSPVEGLSQAIHISAGDAHTCAVTSDALVLCWGDNSKGQLGNGTRNSSPLPVMVVGLDGQVKQVSAGGRHTCAVVGSTNKVMCWGSNSHGQSGAASDALVPANIWGSGDIISLDTGKQHSCAITAPTAEDSFAFCWGGNDTGQLGNGWDTRSINTFSLVYGIRGVAEISTGDLHSCVIGNNFEETWCWGGTISGELTGQPYRANSKIASQLADIPRVKSLTLGERTLCVIRDRRSADVSCYGAAIGLQSHGDALGNIHVPEVSPALSIASNNGVTCVIKNDPREVEEGYLYCWGVDRVWGTDLKVRLGHPPSYRPEFDTDVNPPQPVASPTSSTSHVAIGETHSCAINNDFIVCWGTNFSGELRWNPRSIQSSQSTVVVRPEFNPFITFAQVAAGKEFTCGLFEGGSVACWGNYEFGQSRTGREARIGNIPKSGRMAGIVEIENAISISAGDRHVCVVLEDGHVNCWGDNSDGQLGNGFAYTTSRMNARVEGVAGIENAVSVSSYDDHNCALLDDGSVKCWGNNEYGQVYFNPSEREMRPRRVPGVTGAIAVETGNSTSCALFDDGMLKCWGNGISGTSKTMVRPEKVVRF